MPETGYLAVFLIGLLGGAHCVGMCGGIVGALTVQQPGQSPSGWSMHLSYNVGRMTTYALLGTAAGAIGSVGMLYEDLMPVQLGLYVFANLMLIALGLYLTGVPALLVPFERAGQIVWRRIQPLTRRFLPASRPSQGYPLGLLWGFLPCGLTYSILATALVTGSAVRGGALMLAFGLGTLPNLMLAGVLFRRFRSFASNRGVRLISGGVVLGFGVFGLINAPTLGERLWQGVIC